jgi:hypothetical protein
VVILKTIGTSKFAVDADTSGAANQKATSVWDHTMLVNNKKHIRNLVVTYDIQSDKYGGKTVASLFDISTTAFEIVCKLANDCQQVRQYRSSCKFDPY